MKEAFGREDVLFLRFKFVKCRKERRGEDKNTGEGALYNTNKALDIQKNFRHNNNTVTFSFQNTVHQRTYRQTRFIHRIIHEIINLDPNKGSATGQQTLPWLLGSEIWPLVNLKITCRISFKT